MQITDILKLLKHINRKEKGNVFSQLIEKGSLLRPAIQLHMT